MHPTPRVYRVVGKTLRAERRKARLSQERLAEKARVHPNYIGLVERAERQVSLHFLTRIAKVLKVRLSHLVREV